MIGGAMVGLQSTAIKARLGPLLNGWTNYDAWLPVPKMRRATAPIRRCYRISRRRAQS